MKYVVKLNGEILGSVTSSLSMTDDEICEYAGVELAITEADYENMPENGKYCLDDLEIFEA